MSVWLEMARGERPVLAARTRDKTDRTDKTRCDPEQEGVLSAARGFCPSVENRAKPGEYGFAGGFVRSVPVSGGQSPEAAAPRGFVRGAVVVSQPTPEPAPSAKPSGMVRLAWSGEWVSAERYAAMSDRERNGPRGKLWCGGCREERDRNTALACLDGRACQ